MLEQNDRYMTQESAEVSAAKKRFQIMKKNVLHVAKNMKEIIKVLQTWYLVHYMV